MSVTHTFREERSEIVARTRMIGRQKKWSLERWDETPGSRSVDQQSTTIWCDACTLR